MGERYAVLFGPVLLILGGRVEMTLSSSCGKLWQVCAEHRHMQKWM